MKKNIHIALVFALFAGINAGGVVITYPSPYAALFAGLTVILGLTTIIRATNPSFD